MAPCARLSTAVLPSWVPISCSISSPTISCASPSSSPLEAGACPKTPNRTQSPSENPTKQQEQLQSSMFFSRLLVPFEADERAHRHVELAQLGRAAEVGQV